MSLGHLSNHSDRRRPTRARRSGAVRAIGARKSGNIPGIGGRLPVRSRIARNDRGLSFGERITIAHAPFYFWASSAFGSYFSTMYAPHNKSQRALG
jgi:hypothetical protein